MVIKTVKLSSGGLMPVLGLGTWTATDEKELTTALKAALDDGYRLIDTAYHYKNEAVIGKTLKEYFATGKLKREDVFITTKLPIFGHAPQDVPKLVNMQLEALQTDYIDLYLIHGPVPFKRAKDKFDLHFENGMQVPDPIDHLDTWRAMEKLHDEGKLKALGLSNFNVKQVQRVYDNARIKPANLQIEYHIYLQQPELIQLCKKLNISVTAYAPIGSPGRKEAVPKMAWPDGDPMTDPIVKELAAKYKKTPAQILLRFVVQQDIIAIPKTVKLDRLKENMNIFDFALTDGEMKKLHDIKTTVRLHLWEHAIGHPFYPFDDVKLTKPFSLMP
ncbi:unnamed protein product [Cylicocyclus nassatus]|uniref:NADP-dependent oxidoreductase domain-containing protein n=1 Tax=Cylicocyclus nassatus TaxID=53992 RepID=A0AA36DL98_CYLNA|nr:unnamed protein product [Cylicocyclus nassatus]